MTKFGDLIRLLVDAGVEFIIVGVHALAGSAPYPRGAPPGLPFFWDAQTLLNGLNFTLQTALGDVDLLGEITGGGSYPDLLPHSIEIVIFDRRCRCIDLETLVRVKRAAGRPKDYEAIAELEILLGRRRS
jgi:predicted nucleotidyltransferase